MLVVHSTNRRSGAADAGVAKAVRGASAANLRAYVERLAYPRHCVFGGSRT
jgi:hypothetical protein